MVRAGDYTRISAHAQTYPRIVHTRTPLIHFYGSAPVIKYTLSGAGLRCRLNNYYSLCVVAVSISIALARVALALSIMVWA